MSKTLALIPAKLHSVGVPNKNWKPIHPSGKNCVALAWLSAVGCVDHVVISTDQEKYERVMENKRRTREELGIDMPLNGPNGIAANTYIARPPNLPDTMLAVVQDALRQVPGDDDEIIVLLQPTSPLRTVATVRQAIQMLDEIPEADSVVSVSPAYPKEWLLAVYDGRLEMSDDHWDRLFKRLEFLPDRRQDCQPVYKRDGVVYAFRRRTLNTHGNIYGVDARPLYTPPEEALSIDTPEDWDLAVTRLSARATAPE